MPDSPSDSQVAAEYAALRAENVGLRAENAELRSIVTACFGVIQPLPGIVDDLQINTAVVLPISVEAYAAYALRCWLGAGQYSVRTTTFARRSALASLVIGALAQVAYHLMASFGLHHAPWQITTLVACVPVVVLGLASALAKLVTSDHQDHQADTSATSAG